MLYFDLFDRSYIQRTPVTGQVISNDINYLRRIYNYNKTSICKYYKERNFSVKNTHILSRFLEHFPMYFNYDSYQYIDFVINKLQYLGKHFKFTSEIEKGVIHPGYFYGPQNEEIIIASDENFDIQDTVNNWQTTKSIYTLKHNRNDLKLLLPLGHDDGTIGGISSVMINIPKLALQYREFMKQQYINVQSDRVVLNKNHFIMKYVLPNMIEDYIDYMMLNRIKDTFYGREIVNPKYKHRFKIFEPIIQIDRYVQNTLDVITNKNIDFVNILHNIPLIFRLDASELLGLPDISLTNQIKWALVISRLDDFIFLYDVSRAKDKNRHYINDMKRLVMRITRDHLLDNKFSYETEKQINAKIDYIKNM